MLQRATAFAPSNIALTKYWGKRDHTLNLPLAPSLSVTLSDLGTLTVVAPNPDLDDDVMMVDDQELDPAGMTKVRRVLNIIRQRAGTQVKAGLRSVNTVPTARGLASSASAFAALALAASKAYGLDLDERELSILARTGSGSAARSVAGGYVLWHGGTTADGSDSYAERVFDAEHWPLKILVAVVADQKKKVSSTLGMKMNSAGTSPLFDAWIGQCQRDVVTCQKALQDKNMRALAEVVEGNALAMHATMMSNRPPLLYWQAPTVALIHAVQRLRSEGAECCFTIDAGSSVVVLCEPQDARAVADELAAVAGIEEVLQTHVGSGARLVGDAV
jgi:diphosphomevalonate decarboxylase